jgi:hypothetical protein
MRRCFIGVQSACGTLHIWGKIFMIFFETKNIINKYTSYILCFSDNNTKTKNILHMIVNCHIMHNQFFRQQVYDLMTLMGVCKTRPLRAGIGRPRQYYSKVNNSTIDVRFDNVIQWLLMS